jgi:hypothetical protein
MIDVKKRRIIKEEELGLRKYTAGDLACFNFSQDEEYLILAYL